MPIGTGTILLIGITIGAGAMGGVWGFASKASTEEPAKADDVVVATGEAIEGSVDKATEAERIRAKADADAKVAIASMEATTILAQAVVDQDCTPLTAAMAELSLTAAASQGKQGSAATNLEEAQQDVSKVVDALLENPELCRPHVVEVIEAESTVEGEE